MKFKVVLTGFSLVLAFTGSVLAEERCTALKSFRIPGSTLEITGAQNRAEAKSEPSPVGGYGGLVPAHCRPLCPFPQYAYYTGEGDSEDAANFECQNPE